MPVTVEEQYKGRSGSNKKRAITYLVRGTDDDAVALTNVGSTAPATWDGLKQRGTSITQLADEIFAATVDYGEFTKLDPPASDSVAFEFSYAAKAERFTRSLETIASYQKSGAPTFDFKGAMGLTYEGRGNFSIDGVDVDSPVTHTWSYYPVNATVTSTYQNTLLGLMGSVCDASFKGAAAGEVRFVGCRGGVRTNEDWELRFDFSYSKNQTGLSVGDITGIDKKGHEVLWVLTYEEVVSDVLTPVPWNAFVERVFEDGDFSALGIGV